MFLSLHRDHTSEKCRKSRLYACQEFRASGPIWPRPSAIPHPSGPCTKCQASVSGPAFTPGLIPRRGKPGKPGWENPTPNSETRRENTPPRNVASAETSLVDPEAVAGQSSENANGAALLAPPRRPDAHPRHLPGPPDDLQLRVLPAQDRRGLERPVRPHRRVAAPEALVRLGDLRRGRLDP